MPNPGPNTQQNTSPFWNSRKGLWLQIFLVLLPATLVLNGGMLLLAGIVGSLIVSWKCLKMQGRTWSDLGFRRPDSFKRVALTAIASTLVLIPLTFFLRRLVTQLVHQQPNLEAFRQIEGNVTVLLSGLCIVWTVAAFGEELLFRGFLLNTIPRLFPERFPTEKTKWGISLVVTSVIVGIGHAYQGPTGMILTGIIGFCFGLIYLTSKRNLWPSILTHGLYDTVAFLILFFGLRLDQCW